MNDTIEYKVSLDVRVEANSTEVNSRTRKSTQRLKIPLMTTIIGAILQTVIKAVLHYSFAK